MKLKNLNYPIILLILFCILMSNSAHSQANKFETEKDSLYNKILLLDSVLFQAFNNHDAEKMSTMFTEDLEFYHDKNGLSCYEETVEAFRGLFKQDNRMRRELIKESLEIYPINNYGAVETGFHTFYHFEEGKQIEGTFKFIHLWKNEKGQWKISRIISFDH